MKHDYDYCCDYSIYHGSGKKRTVGYQPITHRYKRAVAQFNKIKEDGILNGKFRKPKDLSIVLVNNYKNKSIFEENMDFLGIKGYCVIRPTEKWSNRLKIKSLLNFINDGLCKTKYIMYGDSRDVIFSDDPNKALDIFLGFNKPIVFNSTLSRSGCYKGFGENSTRLWKWSLKIIGKKRYLNAGVFIGKVCYVREVLDFASNFMCESDQATFRGILPLFRDYIAVDFNNKLVYRN